MADAAHAATHETTGADAEYALECTLRCHHCRQEIDTMNVVRLIRSRVNFVSTLPRRGHVLCCPKCGGILSAELAGSM